MSQKMAAASFKLLLYTRHWTLPDVKSGILVQLVVVQV